MCSPAIAVPLVMGIAQAGLQVAQAKRQANLAESQNRAEAEAAARNFALESTNIQLEGNKAAADAAEARFDNTVATIKRQGEARAAFAGSGVTGGALQSVLDEFSRQGGRANARVGQNLKFSQTSSQLQRRGAFARTVESAALSARNTDFGALDVGTAVLGGVNTGLALRSQFRKPGE